jgi:C-terminal processing protease CtpA/Prc
MLKLTIARWFTPKDVNIDAAGIIPDINIDFEKEDYTPEV